MKFVLLTSFAAAFSPLCTNPTAPCDSISPQTYLGRWFEIGRTQNVEEGKSVCVQAFYSLIEPGLVRVENSGIFNNTLGGIKGTAKILSNSELLVEFRFPQAKFANIKQEAQFSAKPNYVIKNVWVDEKGEYLRALVVSPNSGVGESEESIWILSRENVLKNEEIEDILNYAEKAGYHPHASKWAKTEQRYCIQ